jgi:hypothetical protein
MKIILLPAAFAALLSFAACTSTEPVKSAAENGLRRELETVGNVVSFREVKTEERALPDGKALVLKFESEVKWLTLEEALAKTSGANGAQAYLDKLEYVSAHLGGGAKTGNSQVMTGTLLLAKTDLGWQYKGLVEE